MVTDEDTDERDKLEEQLWTATEGLQRTVMRLFQESDIHSHVMVLALARVTGEVGAGTALAEVVRQAGHEFREMVEAEALPTAGNA